MSNASHANSELGQLSIVIAHDYLTQRGGAERVALELATSIPGSRIVTSVYSPAATFERFKSFDVKASFLNLFSAFRKDPRLALPFLSLAWSSLPRVDADVVICSSSGWSHGVRVTKRTRKVVYCHNPPRWLYQPEDYLLDRSAFEKAAVFLLRPFLTAWDRRAAASADLYIANSTTVASRVKAVYGRDAHVLFPPVSFDIDGDHEPVPGLGSPYFLTVGRARGYKGTRQLIEAFAGLPEEQLVIVGTSQSTDDPANVRALGHVSEEQLRWLYSNARALISVSREDFGLTPIEANAFGTPVLVLRAGGFLDSTAEEVSGAFIDEPSIDCIRRAVQVFPVNWDADRIRRHADQFSRASFSEKILELLDLALRGETRP